MVRVKLRVREMNYGQDEIIRLKKERNAQSNKEKGKGKKRECVSREARSRWLKKIGHKMGEEK